MPARTITFDPGGDLDESGDTELILDAVKALVGDRGERPVSLREGEFSLGGTKVKMMNVLLDTGALHKSYISSVLVDNNRESWKDFILPYHSVARLADQKTTVETKEMVRGWLSFVADDGVTEYAGQVEAIVWVMPGMDFIVGLPDIVSNYVDLLVSVLKSENHLNEVTDMREGEVRMWSNGEVEVSPEELDTPDPVAFGPVLAFMEPSYE